MTDIPAEWWKRAAEVVPYGVACVDLQNKFVYVNHSFCQMLGYSQMELVGRTWMSVTEDDDVGGDLKSVDDLKASEVRDSYTLQKRYIHRDGRRITAQLLVHSFHDEGRLTLFIACAGPVVTTEAFFERYESRMKHELDELRDELRKVQEERAFRLKVFAFIKEYWPIIAGVFTLIGSAIWNLAKGEK
jgi:PAS domain S-box-containing protein